MRFGDINNYVLFGGGPALIGVARWCAARDQPVVVFTSPRQAEEIVTPDRATFSDVLEADGVTYFTSLQINEEPNLKQYVAHDTLGIALAPAWIFRKAVLDLFDQRLVNFHGIPLPRVRGGAHYTWQILRGDRSGGCNIQLIERKLDAGAVIKSIEYQLPPSARIPADYFEGAREHDLPFLNEFLDEVESGKDFETVRLPEMYSTYYPRLSTPENGLIDWSWSTHEIERFICAFDSPYPGASTYIGERRLILRDCVSSFDDGPFHPFQAGLIYRRMGDRTFVASIDGSIIVDNVLAEDGTTARIRVGDRFHTPFAALDRSHEFHAKYSAVGIAPSSKGTN